MLIGELATRISVSTGALRHYEKLGMLHSERGENGYRHYGEESVEWVKFQPVPSLDQTFPLQSRGGPYIRNNLNVAASSSSRMNSL
jgi:DNA-binding transcriptional MerR regulator